MDSTTLEQAHEFPTFKQQEELEYCLNGSNLRTFRDMDIFVEDAIRTMMEIEERAKSFKQRLVQMRRYENKDQYAVHHPREEAAAEPSVQASTINDERPGQTHQNLKLCFNGSLKSTIYTNKPLLGQSSGAIEITICRDDQIITLGHLASLSVEIVALERDHTCNGEWTEEDFDRQIRKSRNGQGSVLDGECLLKLVNGKASLGNIRFKEGSTVTRSREFVLAARVCRSENIGGSRVEEAFMDPPFSVLVERSKGNEKSSLPKLDDKIYDLKGIARNGPYARRLEKENIYTVQDFLKAYNKDQNKLHQTLEIKSLHSWEAMVRHARECDLRDRHELRSYKIKTSNVSLFFNCIDDLVGAIFNGLYVPKDKFNTLQKVLVDKQLQQAYSELDGIPFDYVMESNQPVKIFTNIGADYAKESSQPVQISMNTDAAGSTSIPSLLSELTQNAPAAENLSPYGYGIYHVPDLSLENTNQNAIGQGSSELPCPVHCNGQTNQGQSDIPYHNIMPGCSFGGTFADVAGTQIFCPQASGLSKSFDYGMENNYPVETFQASAENMRPLGSGADCVPGLTSGDANRNAARHSTSEPFLSDCRNGHVNQDLEQNCIPVPEGGGISPNSASQVTGHMDNMDHVDDMEDELWESVLGDLQKQTNIMTCCSPGGTFAAQGTLVYCDQDNVSEAPNDVPFWPQRVSDPELVMPDQTICDTTCPAILDYTERMDEECCRAILPHLTQPSLEAFRRSQEAGFEPRPAGSSHGVLAN